MLLALLIVCAPGEGAAQTRDYGARLGKQRGGDVSFEPRGPGVLFDALDPAVRRWYVPQELYELYQWRQWDYTNYARDHYQRYVSTDLEGDYFYDLYGSFVTKGWLVYDWREQQPQQFGSTVFKTPRFSSFFSDLVISSDQKGEHHLGITIGSKIRTTLTPMTFSKPAFDGIQIDYQADKYSATILMSRISSPGLARQVPVETTNSTKLFGLHNTIQIGDFARVGGTYINAHNTQSLLESFEGNPFTGVLTVGQNLENISQIFIRLSDDSPGDQEGGAALFSWDIIIEAETDVARQTADGKTVIEREKQVVRGSEINFQPIIDGGFQRLGFLAADGDEQIELTYDFRGQAYTGPDLSTIRRAQIELVVANDYHIEMSSDRQTNLPERQPVFLTLDRAAGNVKDGSNLRLLRFDYGLPTGNDLFGFSLELENSRGALYAEWDRSRLFRKFPNRAFTTHRSANDSGDAWMINLSQKDYPWFLFGELYSMDFDYSTTSLLSTAAGDIDYTDPATSFYEWVDDNDDQDRTPDWQRVNHGGPDLTIFPGWDENLDFISDFNQNNNTFRPNFIPDYEEPFLRFNVDRPEFLFGVDTNNNFWIDRFENDEEPDYPYKRDRRGGNAYIGVHIVPSMRATVGYKRERMLSAKRKSISTYGLFTWDTDLAGIGRIRVFDMFKLVKDDIADNLVQWTQPVGAPGALQRLDDPVAAPDTWINSAFISFNYTGADRFTQSNKLKYDIWRQRQRQVDFRRSFQFFGLINKLEYHQPLIDNVALIPRIKNELRLEAPLLRNSPVRKENTLLLSLIAETTILRASTIQAGLEYVIFSQLEDPAPAGLSDDARELVAACQYTNTVAYLGYKLMTQLGIRINRINRKNEDAFTGVSQFVTVFAGLD
jgi:hypothetical protein